MQKAGFFLWILVCAVLIFDIGNACVRAQDSSSRLKSQEIDIVNASGVTVIQIVNMNDGPNINLLDPNSRVRLAPGAASNGGGLIFQDSGGNNITTLCGLDYKDGSQSALSLKPAGQASVGLIADSGYGGLSIDDKAGKQRVEASFYPKGDISLVATESAKDQTAIYAGLWGKMAHTVFDDPNGTPRADFGIEANDNAYFAIGGKDGTAGWLKTFDPDGSPTTLGDNTAGSGGSDTGIGNAIRRNGSP